MRDRAVPLPQVHWDLQRRVCRGGDLPPTKVPAWEEGGAVHEEAGTRTSPVPRLPPFKLFHRELSTGPGWRSGLFKKSFKFQRTV